MADGSLIVTISSNNADIRSLEPGRIACSHGANGIFYTSPPGEHSSYGDFLEVRREYYQNSSVLDCVTQCSQSVAHLYEQFLQVKQIGFVTLGPLRCA